MPIQKKVISEKVTQHTDLETVSELFCTDDRKSHHRLKQAI